MDSKKIIIGIDVGINTGVAIWDIEKKVFIGISTMSILKAFVLIGKNKHLIKMVYVEDPRKVNVATDRRKSQGAGSVKRDVQIWEDFLKMYKISATFVRPNRYITKMSSEKFKELTGYAERINEHGRDAAMLVFNK